MNRSIFITVIATVLILAFALGWFAHWLVHRLTRVSGGDVDEIDRLAQELHEAEELRDRAITWGETRESELSSRVTQTEAELRAAMEGLRDSRAEAEELRAYVEKLSAKG